MLSPDFYERLDALYRQGRAQEARQYLEGLLAEADLDENNHADRATILNELMGHCRTQGDFEACDAALQRLLREIRALRLKGGPEYATFMLNIAHAYRAMGKLADAERTFLVVRDIYEAELPEDDYRLASLYNNLGLTYRAKGELEVARSYMERALVIVEKLSQSVAIAASSSNLADLLIEAGDLESAAKHAARARFIFEESNTQGVDYSAALAAEGRIAYLRGDLDLAEERYRKAADCVFVSFGQTRSYRTLLSSLAEVLRAQGIDEEAAQIQTEAEQES
ncbi:MAG: tetratricopeptide repeat protein [Atopobiaceae bacterium]|nr:tetratricopeptide repeat protein [Atopobiaceae bacterium]